MFLIEECAWGNRSDMLGRSGEPVHEVIYKLPALAPKMVLVIFHVIISINHTYFLYLASRSIFSLGREGGNKHARISNVPKYSARGRGCSA